MAGREIVSLELEKEFQTVVYWIVTLPLGHSWCSSHIVEFAHAYVTFFASLAVIPPAIVFGVRTVFLPEWPVIESFEDCPLLGPAAVVDRVASVTFAAVYGVVPSGVEISAVGMVAVAVPAALVFSAVGGAVSASAPAAEGEVKVSAPAASPAAAPAAPLAAPPAAAAVPASAAVSVVGVVEVALAAAVQVAVPLAVDVVAAASQIDAL